MICAKLLFINIYKEKYWYVDSHEEWKDKPGRRYIKTTTQDEGEAKCFQDANEAGQVLVLADRPDGWTVVVQEVEAMPIQKPMVPKYLRKYKPRNPGSK